MRTASCLNYFIIKRKVNEENKNWKSLLQVDFQLRLYLVS